MVFERFSDQARQVVVLAAGAARTHHQDSVGTEHLPAPDPRRRRPRSSSADLMGRHRAGTREQARGCQRTGRLRPGRGAHPEHRRRRRRSSKPVCARPPCSGTRRSAPNTSSWRCSTTPPPPALTSSPTLHPCPSAKCVSTSDANRPNNPPQQPTPGPAHRIPIRLSNDEYTRAHAAAHTAGQNLETSGPRPHHRRPRTTRITGSIGGEEQRHRHEEPHHQRHERAHHRAGRSPCSDRPRRCGP